MIFEGRIKVNDVRGHRAPVVLWFSKGLELRSARRGKMTRGADTVRREDLCRFVAHRAYWELEGPGSGSVASQIGVG